MASLTYMASAVLMGGLLLAVVVYLLGAREWYHYTPAVAGAGTGDVFTSTARVVRSPVTWTVSFLVFVAAVVGAGMAFVAAPEVEFVDPGLTSMALTGLAALLLVIYLFGGTVYLAKSRGFGDAAATAFGAGVITLLFIGVVFLKLLTGL
jgi:hypothetical protein